MANPCRKIIVKSLIPSSDAGLKVAEPQFSYVLNVFGQRLFLILAATATVRPDSTIKPGSGWKNSLTRSYQVITSW